MVVTSVNLYLYLTRYHSTTILKITLVVSPSIERAAFYHFFVTYGFLLHFINNFSTRLGVSIHIEAPPCFIFSS